MNMIKIVHMARMINSHTASTCDRDAKLSAMSHPDTCHSLDEIKQKLTLRVTDVNPGLVGIVSAHSGLSIETHTLAEGSDLLLRQALYSYVMQDAHKAIIKCVRSNHCGTRFSIAKELMHVYIGVEDGETRHRANEIVMCAAESRKVVPDATKELDDETAAFYLAIEVMIPWQLRTQFMMMRDMEQTTYQIAKAFMIPERVIDHITSGERSNYVALSKSINESL